MRTRNEKWPLVRLGEVLTKTGEPIDADPSTEYSEITVKIWGKGVVERRRVLGSEVNGRRFVACEGNFILSRIDARHGAMGLVPDSLDGALVTNDFPLFAADTERLDLPFLGWLCRTRDFVDLCIRASEGSTNRVRLKEERFLALEIPLPPLPEQRRIVARIEALAAEIDEAKRLRREAVEQAGAFVASTKRSIFGCQPDENWIPLNNFVASIENGKSPATEGRPADADEWGVLKVGAVSFGRFDERQNKALPVSFKVPTHLEVKAGDFIMSRANTLELVGACTVVKTTRPKLMLSDKTFRFLFPKPSLVDERYLDYLLKSPALREQIERGASGTSPTMKNISKEKVLALRVPNTPLPEQRRIVAELDALQAEVDALKRLQSETAAELDALLPAILDRAFKGEL